MERVLKTVEGGAGAQIIDLAFQSPPPRPGQGSPVPAHLRGAGAPRGGDVPVPVGSVPHPFGPGNSSAGIGDGGCVDVLDDVDTLLMSIDSCNDGAPDRGEGGEDVVETGGEGGSGAVATEGGGSNLDSSVIPWMDRYESTERLLKQLEETLSLMEARGVNLSSAWELANTARSLLDSADVIMALIYANRALRLALEVHRLHDGLGGTAS